MHNTHSRRDNAYMLLCVRKHAHTRAHENIRAFFLKSHVSGTLLTAHEPGRDIYT